MFERINIFGSGFGFDIMQEVELDRAESKLTAVPYNAKSKLTSVPDSVYCSKSQGWASVLFKECSVLSVLFRYL